MSTKNGVFFLLIGMFSVPLHLAAQHSSGNLNYHRNVTKAEVCIAQQNYAEALAVLEETFQAGYKVFLRDYKVAAQLALLLKDEQKALHYIRCGVASGWTLKEIKKNKFLRSLQKLADWKALEYEYDSIRMEYHKRIIQPLRKQVYEMYRADQKMAMGALLRIGQKAQNRYAEKKFAPHSEKQLTTLAHILAEYGYPGEQLIGNSYWASTILSHHNSISQKYVEKDTLYPAIRPALFAAIDRGEISPFELALIEDWRNAVRNNHRSGLYGFLGPINSNSLHTVNQLRAAIGLRSIELRNQLVEVQQQTGIDLYLQGKPWQRGKIAITGSKE